MRLLDDHKRVVDALELSGPYASAILKDAVVEGDSAVSFSFFGDDRWRLNVRRPAALPFAFRCSRP